MSNQTKIVLVDDHPLFRDGVARTLESDPAFDVVGQGATADDAFRLVGEHLPEVVLLDISMPGGGIDAAGRISLGFPAVKIIMLTVSENDEDVIAALRAGARAYILKGVSGPDLMGIIKGVCEGGSYVSPNLAARLLVEMQHKGDRSKSNDPLDALTAREEQILRLIARGLSNKEIGGDLSIKEKTVKHYVTNILQKLQVRNRVEAALMAQERLPKK